MKIKVRLKNSNPSFFEDILPIMSDELILQIKKRKKTLIMEQSEYDDILTELSAIENDAEEYSPDFKLEVDHAIDDFMSKWTSVFEGSSEI